MKIKRQNNQSYLQQITFSDHYHFLWLTSSRIIVFLIFTRKTPSPIICWRKSLAQLSCFFIFMFLQMNKTDLTDRKPQKWHDNTNKILMYSWEVESMIAINILFHRTWQWTFINLQSCNKIANMMTFSN